MALEKYSWQNGTLVTPARVEVGGQSYDVEEAIYEGETPLSASNLNLMQETLLGNVINDLSDDSKVPNIEALKGIIKIVPTSHTVNFNSTGWKHGNFTYTEINGYTLVAVQPLQIPYGDNNFISYNIYNYASKIYWNGYCSYTGSTTTATVNLIYIKNEFISS